ncbi:MAG: HAD family hydrolase [Acidimicrobiales bacterium]
MARAFDAVSLDVGGVLVVPDHGAIAGVLERLGVAHRRSRFYVGHYEAMAAVDRAASRAEDFTDYIAGFLAAVGVAQADRDRAHAALVDVLRTPVWCQPVPGSRAAVRALADAGFRLAITSNSDGTVADHLARHEWVQVGEGPGVPVEVVIDSGSVGVGKPDARVFQATVDGLGLPAERILHIGDSAFYDVAGAAAVGMQAVHMDPFRLCDGDHPHVAALSEVVER